MHDLPLISTIAAAFTAAWLLGLVTQRLGLSPIVGYLLAGVLIGPHTPGFQGDVQIATQLAEVGVILLMFGVGLHFHLKDLLAVKAVAIPGAIGQSLVAALVAMGIFLAFDIPAKTGAVIGMAMAVASTVVLMRVLMDADALNSPQGHVAVGWLIVEDIFTVVLLVLIPVLGSPVEGDSPAAVGSAVQAASLAASTLPAAAEAATQAVTLAAASLPATSQAATLAAPVSIWHSLAWAFAKLFALVGIVFIAGARIIPWALVRVARLRSRELFTLTVLVFSIAIAAGSYYVFGASMALGAFLAGMVVAQSPVSHQAAADALPMRDAFAVLFFVSVGMLFDPMFLVQQPLMVVAALVVILIAKPLAALLIVAVLGHSARTALTVAIGLAQIGEFSFILSDLARRHGLMPEAGHNVLVASAILSITINPVLFRNLPRIEAWLRARPTLWKLLNGRAERRAAATNAAAAGEIAAIAPDTGLSIVIGFGPVGRSVHRLLEEAKLETVVIDLNMDSVSLLNQSGQRAIFGDAAHETILEQAGIRRATHLILTLPSSGDRAAIVALARGLNPRLRIFVRARYLKERDDLRQAGASAAVFEEAEAAVALARLVLAETGVQRAAAEGKIKDLRLQLITESLSNLRTQRVGSVMMPWARVKWLRASADRTEVTGQMAQERFSRWPVVDTASGRVTGYLLTKDLIGGPADQPWSSLVRSIRAITPEQSVETVLASMQSEGATLYVVEAGGRPVGLITLEDILEQVVGQIEDEYPREAAASLAEAVDAGAILLDLAAATHEQAIAELAAAIGPAQLPPGGAAEVTRLALEREREFSTDLGNSAAVPHARVPGLAAPIVAFGRSVDGIVWSATSQERVRLLFLLVTPAEQPEAQLALLGQIASLCNQPSVRDALLAAESPADITTILGHE